MNQPKTIGLVVLAALGLLALTSTASATTFEVGGVTKNESVTFTMSLASGTTLITKNTSGAVEFTCTESDWPWETKSPYSDSNVTGPVKTMSFGSCTTGVVVHDPGKLSVEHIAGTTNATVHSEGTILTRGSLVGTLTCTTGEGTHLGTLTGTASGHATLHISAVINCGFFQPSVKWEATYTVTSPTGLGVSA